jgi:hypothetical protein
MKKAKPTVSWNESMHVNRGKEAESDEIQEIVRHHRKDPSAEFHDHPHPIDLDHVTPADLGKHQDRQKEKQPIVDQSTKIQKRQAG